MARSYPARGQSGTGKPLICPYFPGPRVLQSTPGVYAGTPEERNETVQRFPGSHFQTLRTDWPTVSAPDALSWAKWPPSCLWAWHAPPSRQLKVFRARGASHSLGFPPPGAEVLRLESNGRVQNKFCKQRGVWGFDGPRQHDDDHLGRSSVPPRPAPPKEAGLPPRVTGDQELPPSEDDEDLDAGLILELLDSLGGCRRDNLSIGSRG